MTVAPALADRRRTTLLRVATATWLLLISAVVLIDHVALSDLAEQAETRAPGAQVAVLEGRLAELAEQVELVRRQPAAVTQARYDTEHQAVTQRLADIELALGERLVAGDLRSLQDRLAHLEARQAQRPISQAAPRPSAPETPRSKPAGPSFQVLGVELRADERFLSIRPYGASALPQVRLLRVGEEEDGWRLESIEDGSATFHRAGEHLRITVPAHQGGSR
ncbi:hypothetical protein [Aromatoleum aromaticum]|uniref:hypothetical protein n=1 Tax=Aromatoleum aromaticum TaxID=551760 RepID=UPI0014596787|nr:hypothetical protein [Aromatoleum aromaticum]NMG55082.1 hypothetical protein [Aromatoleum aromaticum]